MRYPESSELRQRRTYARIAEVLEMPNMIRGAEGILSPLC